MVALPPSLPREQLKAFCVRWKVKELALFGSILRGDFSHTSDVDVLFTLQDGAPYNWTVHCDMKEALEAIFGRPVDLVEKALVEASPNWIRRKEILSNQLTVYAA